VPVPILLLLLMMMMLVGYTWNHLLLASEAAAQLSELESFATDGEDGWRGG